MIARALLALACLAAGAPATLRGQYIRLNDRTELEAINGPSVGHEHAPLRAIVLWRGVAGWSQSKNSAERARTDSIYRWAQLHANEAGLSFFGTGLRYGLLTQGNTAITIEGQRFALTKPDSALVIMVDVPPGGLSRTVRTAYVSADMPPDYWTRTWQSGDTMFVVRPDLNRQAFMLLQALNRSPVVAAFLQ